MLAVPMEYDLIESLWTQSTRLPSRSSGEEKKNEFQIRGIYSTFTQGLFFFIRLQD